MQTKKTAAAVCLVVAYLILPLLLPAVARIPKILTATFFYGAAGLLVFMVSRAGSGSLDRQNRTFQALLEKNNLTQDSIRHQQANRRALRDKITRYSSLKTVIEQVNESLTLDEISERFVEICFSLIARSRGVCMLYLADAASRSLRLAKTRKQDSSLVVKSKHGDMFDSWVQRHGQPLMIEDITRDFRFDRDRLSTQDSRAIGSLISAPLFAGTDFLGVLRLDHPDFGFYNQEDLRFLVSLSDIGAVALENARLYEHTQDLAIHDGLTGLFTKAHFFQLLENECTVSLRHARVFSLLVIDIDFFKQYNDTFGHAAGDLVLRAFSDTLKRFTHDTTGVACRFGGEEFCVILPLKDKQAGLSCAEQLRQSVEKISVSLRRQETRATVSIGVSSFPVDGTEGQELIKRADKAMYEAKRAGRNRVAAA